MRFSMASQINARRNAMIIDVSRGQRSIPTGRLMRLPADFAHAFIGRLYSHERRRALSAPQDAALPAWTHILGGRLSPLIRMR